MICDQHDAGEWWLRHAVARGSRASRYAGSRDGMHRVMLYGGSLDAEAAAKYGIKVVDDKHEAAAGRSITVTADSVMVEVPYPVWRHFIERCNQMIREVP